MKRFDMLWLRLTVVFSLLIIFVVGSILWAGTRLADTQFRRYVTNSALRLSGSIADQLAAYYKQNNNSWDGVAEAIETSIADGITGLGVPAIQVAPGQPFPFVDLGSSDPRSPAMLELILTNARGRVLYHNTHKLEGRRLGRKELQNSYAITDPDSGDTIGYLLVSLPAREVLGTLERQFLSQLQRLVGVGGAMAILAAMVASVLFSLNLTAPLRRVADAAKAVAAGDFTKRVPVQGSIEIAQVAENFNEMTEALQKAEQLRQNLVADVAHELRTPLSVVQGNLRAILDDVYPLSKEEITHLYDETRLLSRLTDDLQELAQADAGQLRLHRFPVETSAWLQGATAKYGPAAEMKGITIELDVPEDLGIIRADPDRLAQVLANLFSNALRHTNEGGRITVSARKRMDLAVPAVEVSVADTGEGIDPKDLAYVFDRFYRADRSRSREHGGSGLGLAIAQSLIRMHDGTIWAESELGRGATFIFRIPLDLSVM